MLEEEIKTYRENRAELIETALGKYILIKGNKIVNTFESQIDAINAGIENFGNVPFLVKKIEQFEKAQIFTSNLIRVGHPCNR